MMILKTLIFISLSINIFFQHGKWSFDTCNVDIAKMAIPPVIWYEQSIDGKAQRTLFTRFLHNKPGVFMSEAAKCYFQALDPFLLYRIIGPAGLLSFIIIIYKLIDSKKYLMLSILFTLPILPFINFPVTAQIMLYKITSIVGIFFFIKNINASKT